MNAPTLGLTRHDITYTTNAFWHTSIGVHEAGHAILAQSRGIQPDEIVIRCQVGSYVYCARGKSSDAALIAAAGAVAEQRWLRQLDMDGLLTPALRQRAAMPPMSLPRATDDLAALRDQLPNLRTQTIEATIRRAERHIARLWPAILKLGQHLATQCVNCPTTPTPPIATPTPRPATPTPIPTPAPQPATTATTHGGTGMSIEELRAAIAEAEQRAQNAAQQLEAARSELDDATQVLMRVTQGSNAPEITEAVGMLQQLVSETEDMPARISVATESAGAYAGHL